MTAAASPFHSDQVHHSRNEHRSELVKYLAHSTCDHVKNSRAWFRDLLWRAFPAHSERDLAQRAARVLEVSPRQVQNWRRCENDASLRYVTIVMAIAGAEVVLRQVEGNNQ